MKDHTNSELWQTGKATSQRKRKDATEVRGKNGFVTIFKH